MKKNSLFLLTISVIILFLLSGSLILTTYGTALAQLRVITVPWYPPDLSEPHNAYNGHPTTFKAIAKGGTGTYIYEWDFNGDGIYEYSNTTTNSYNLSATFTYPNQASEKIFYAKIRVTSGSETAYAEYPVIIYPDPPAISPADHLNVRVNVAIDDGLWSLHLDQQRYSSGGIDYGRWSNAGATGGYEGYTASPTASAVQAFMIHGHLETGNIGENPYVETVSRGLKYMFTQLNAVGIGPQHGDNPDTNGNGIGIQVTSGRSIYELGQIMDAIVATGDPDQLTTTGGSHIIGRKYKDILQDMVDMYAWGQYDTWSVGGGWRYVWNQHPDNSAAQWGAIGMLAAEEGKKFNLTIPDWVKTWNNQWLNYSYNGTGFGYTGPGNGVATTPGGMIQLAFCDKTTADGRWQTAENWIANNWSWWLGQNNGYAYYAFVKAMREAQQDADLEPEPIKLLSATNFDWYGDLSDGLAVKLVNLQASAGYWPVGPWYIGQRLNTAWSLIILNATLWERDPVAKAKANPTSVPCGGGSGGLVTFDHSDSLHKNFPENEIVLYKWDFDKSDGIDWDNPDYSTTDPDAKPTYTYVNHGEYTATLQVVDDNDPPKTATDEVVITVNIENHRPVADPDGPYEILENDGVTLVGDYAYDPDEACGDEIVEYLWDLDNDGITDDAIGETVILTWADLNSSGISGPGVYTIRLMVVDTFGEEDIETTTLSVYSNEPVAVAEAEPLEAPPKYPINFDGSKSHHTNPERDIVEYKWDFGDGNIGYGINATHEYDTVGTFTVMLEVTDNNVPPLTDTDTVEVEIKPPPNPPVADADPDDPDDGYIIEIGEGVTLDGSNSYDPDSAVWGDYIASYAWDMDNDGQFDDSSTAVVSLSWADLQNMGISGAGDHTITLKVTDAGLYGSLPLNGTEATTLSIYINEPVAVAKAIPDEVGCNQEVNFDGSGSFHEYPLRSIVKYEWDFESDGTYDAEGIEVAHTYNTFGTYQATLRVTDNNVPPKTATDQVNVGVSSGNSPPVADANPYDTTPAYTTYVGSPILLDGSQSYDPDGNCGDQIVEYAWDTDNDDLYGTEDDPDDLVGVKITYINPAWISGSHYTAHLRVADIFGATDGDTATIYIIDECYCNLSARPKRDKVQLTWIHDPAAECYHIYRSTNPKVGLIPSNRIATCHETTYATYLDYNVNTGITYYYRVTKVVNDREKCVSNEAVARPSTRTR